MPTAAEHYNEALALARAGKYGAALDALKTVSHPKARELEAKIRAKMEEEFPIEAIPAPTKSVSKRKPPRYRRYTLPLLIVLGAFVLVVGVVTYRNYRQSSREASIYVQTMFTCLHIYESSLKENCDDYAHTALEIYRDEIEYCYDQTNEGDLEQQFLQCLVDNGVKI